MMRLILVATFMLLLLSGGNTLFIADEAYADCCMCGHYVEVAPLLDPTGKVSSVLAALGLTQRPFR